MTVVAAWLDSKGPHITSDLACDSHVRRICTDKVWRSGDVLYGCAGDANACAMLYANPFRSKTPGSEWDEVFAIKEVAPHFQAIMEPIDDDCSWIAVAACEGGLFVFEGDGTVFRVGHDVLCIGSGSEVAYGYLSAVGDLSRKNSNRLAADLVTAVAKYIPSVGGGYHYVDLQNEKLEIDE